MKAPKEKTVEELSTQTDLIRSQLEALQSSTGKEDEKKELEWQLSDLWREISDRLASTDITDTERKTLEGLKADIAPFTTELASLQESVDKGADDEKGNEDKDDVDWESVEWAWWGGAEEQENDGDSESEDASDEKEEKWIFWKTWDWTKEQWWDVRDGDKWRDEPALNTLRTAWFVATGIGAVALIYKWVKKLFWSDEKKEEKEKEKKDSEEKWMSRWKKWLLWVWWALWITVAWASIYKNWDSIKLWFKEKLGDSLSLEDAVKSATAEVRGSALEESAFTYQFDEWIKYDENKQVIRSYWWETKINPNKNTIEWLNGVVFPDKLQLVHAANIVNCLKKNFHNCCASEDPFMRTTGWDLQVHLADWTKPECLSASDSNTWTYILWSSWAVVGGLLWWYFAWIPWGVGLWATLWLAWVAWGAAIDNDSSLWNNAWEVSSWVKFKKFINYLNDQKDGEGKSLWKHKNDVVDSDSVIKDEAATVLEQIRATYAETWERFERNFDVEPDANDRELFYVKSYNEKVPLRIKGCGLNSDWKLDYSKIQSIKIWKYHEEDWWEWLDLDFPHSKEWIEEAIRTANLTNKIRKDFHNKWGEDMPFGCKIYGYHRHLQIDDKGYRWRNIVYRDTLESRFPMLWDDVTKQVNQMKQEKLYEQAYSNKSLENYGSCYIRYLHQMRENSLSYRKPKD